MRNATPDELDLFKRMSATIRQHEYRNRTRTTYVEMEHVIPMRSHQSVWSQEDIEYVPLGWPGKAARVFGGRLTPTPHRIDSDDLKADLEAAWADTSLAVVEAQAVKGAIRHGCAFVFTSAGGDGEPEVVASARSARQATAIVDPRTRRTLAALEDLGGGMWNLYRPGWAGVVSLWASGLLVVHDEFEAPRRVLCTPFIHDIDMEKPFGSSRITREQMGITNAGIRTFHRSEVSADYYQAPRHLFRGASIEDLLADDGVSVALRKDVRDVWGIPDISTEDDPDVPDELRRVEVTTLPQMSMQPFSEQMRMIVGQFSQASSVPLHYLGFTHDANPTNADALGAHETDLIRAVREQIPYLSMARRQFAVDVLTVLHGDGLIESEVGRGALRTLQAGYLDPKEISASEASQMVQLQTSSGNLRTGGAVALELLPLTPEQRAEAARENRLARGVATLSALRQSVEE